ncbi:MAG: SIMPL domain-containing protein [Minisyncoccia bacterium]
MEKTKQYLNVAIIVALLVAAYSVWMYASSYSQSVEPGTFRSFSASGEGKVVAVPDVAQFSFTVVTEGGKDLGALQTENTKKVNTAIDFVKGEGVDVKDIKTQSYNISPRYQYYSCNHPELSVTPCPPSEIVGYTVTQSVQVKVRDFSKTGDILGGVVKAGANTVSSLQFTIDDPTSVKAQARAEAIGKAKKQAEEIADAGSFRIGKLLSIDESGAYYAPRAYGMGGDAISAKVESYAAPAIEAGSQDVTVNVTLRYEIR